jgi:hypothetical protein
LDLRHDHGSHLPYDRQGLHMKRFRFEVSVRKSFVVYADSEDEAVDRALQEEIIPDDVELTMKEPAQPNED